MISKKVIIDANQSVDCLIEQLNSCFMNNKNVLLVNYMSNIYNQIAIQYSINKYKPLIKSIKVYQKNKTMVMSIVQKNKIIKNSKKSYLKIMKEYDKNYYLTDCGGYQDYNNSKGGCLDKRLQSVFNLVNPSKGEEILDVGCGRGELAFSMAQEGANVLAIDYSYDAIELAKTNFRKLSNLKYICEDIFNLDSSIRYDKIVLADIVEHIEQPMLEKMLAKISLELKTAGVIVIHTAPNKEYYETYWPRKVKQALEMGVYLPENPRSYYEEIMHINEQTPQKLRETLESIFPEVIIWTGEMRDMYVNKNSEQQILDNSIFAICANNQGAIETYMENLTKMPDVKEFAVRISSLDAVVDMKENKEMTMSVVVENIGKHALDSDAYYNCNLSYHILDCKTNQIVLYDGIRTRLPQVVKSGQKIEMDMNLILPSELEVNKKYKIMFSIVVESCFWVDDVENSCKINLI